MWIASVALIYFLAARLSLMLLFQPEGIAAIWPPTGIFLSAVLLARRNLRPWLVGTLFVTDLIAEVLAGTPFLVSAVYSLSLAGDAVFGAWLLFRFVGEPISFQRIRHMAGWLALSVLFSNALTSLVAAAASTFLPGVHSFWNSWRWSAAPDGVGNLLVTPLIVTWSAWIHIRSKIWSRQRAVEGAALFISMAVLSFSLFSNLSEHKLFALFLPYVTLPFLLWAALRFGVRGVATALVVQAAIAVPFVATGNVPGFSFDSGVLDDVIVLQLILAVTAIPALFMAVVVTERQQAHEGLEESEQRYRTMMDQAADGIFMRDEAGRIRDVNRKACASLGYTRDELLSMTVGDIDHETIQAGNQRLWGRILAGESFTFESHQIRKDGSILPVEVTLGSVQLPSGPAVMGIVRDITQRKQAEERLRQTNRALRMVSDCNQELVRATNEADLLQGICRIAVEHGGYRMAWVGFAERDEAKSVRLVAQSGFDDGYLDQLNITWADAERGRGPTGTAIRTGQPVATRDIRSDPAFALWREAAIRRGYASCIALPLSNDGRCFGALMMYSMEPNAFDPEEVKLLCELAGDLAYGIGSLRQRAERELAEAALREREQRLVSVYDAVGDVIFQLDVDTEGRHRFSSVNRAFLATTGLTAAQVVGQRVDEVIPQPSLSLALEKYATAIREKKIVRWEETSDYPTGRLTGEVSIAPVFDKAGHCTLLIGAVHDVTERKRTDETLRKSEERFREQAALLDAANDAIYVRAMDHTVTYWNVGAERLYGWSRAEALGHPITELGDVDPEAFAAAHAELLDQGSWSGELNKTSRSGRKSVVFCRWTLLRDDQGAPREVLAINTDITEKKHLESQFLRAQRMEGIGSLAGGIAHDLNNILTPILLTMPLLRETATDSESREMLDTVQTCAQRGADIIRQLLTFARGRPDVRVPLPMRHLLREMDTIIRETFPRNIHLVITVPDGLWSVLGDATQIHQALMNLCVNARDAMPAGGTMTLAAENQTVDKALAEVTPDARPGAHVCVSVTDTGTGIQPEQLERIFDPFFTTKEIGKGTGLGLPTVLGIVRGHGGFVRVDSRVGRGTRFELFLPASTEANAVATPDREPPPPRGQGELILVVDDEAAVRVVVRRMLEVFGYQVLAAEEGNEALILFGQRRAEIKAVIADMMMPGMDGPALVQALRRLEPRLPILIMTGLAERAGIKGLEDLELPQLLTKPFAPPALLVALHDALAVDSRKVYPAG
jgi:PAS domain S-box-containing protein